MSNNKNNNITMTIKNMNIFGTWKYDAENKDCSICEHDLLLPSKKSMFKNKINGEVIIGLCKHGFHDDCIRQWVKSDNISCPICKNIWIVSKIAGETTYLYKNT